MKKRTFIIAVCSILVFTLASCFGSGSKVKTPRVGETVRIEHDCLVAATKDAHQELHKYIRAQDEMGARTMCLMGAARMVDGGATGKVIDVHPMMYEVRMDDDQQVWWVPQDFLDLDK